MTIKEFINEIQGLYGQYNQFQIKHVAGWCSNKSEQILSLVFKYVIENVSWTHNKRPPGLAEFNTAIKEIYKSGTLEIKQFEPVLIAEEDKVPDEVAAEFMAGLKNKIKSKNLRMEAE